MASLLQRFRPVVFLLLAGLVSAMAGAEASSKPVGQAPIQQLRVYEIFENNKQAFHARFRDDAMRIMAKYDFRIVAMWESRTPERTEFVYVLEWPDEATLKDRWSRFLADEEWKAIKRRTGKIHGTLVGNIEDRVLRATDYSPRSRFFAPGS